MGLLRACTGAAVMVLLLCRLQAAQADAPALVAGGFDQALAARVFTAAFTFMLPRTLQAASLPQMTIWGLRGITALDPSMTPVLGESELTLVSGPGRVLATLALPAIDDVAGWGALAAEVSAAAFRSSEPLRRAGTEGMIGSFFDEVFNHMDPYSRYVPRMAAEIERGHRRGAAGTGMMLAWHGGALVVSQVVAGSPADAAGVAAGDRLVSIDGASAGRLEAAAAALGGDEGSPVAVGLRRRDGRSERLVLTRALVPADTVSAERRGELLVLQIAGFTASTGERMRQELLAGLGRPAERGRSRPAGVVVDLRGNRGGLLRQAVDAANLLLKEGRIATTQGRDPDADHDWQADGQDLAEGLPVIVLVDGRSASAAEVLAAALADDGRAVVVGSATLGKGLVQTVASLPDGGELFVTWSRVLAPDDWPLQGLGVMPQLCTSLGEAHTDAQLEALNSGSQPMEAVLRAHRDARPGLPVAEMLAIRNACPAALGQDADMDAARYLVANPVAYAAALAPM